MFGDIILVLCWCDPCHRQTWHVLQLGGKMACLECILQELEDDTGEGGHVSNVLKLFDIKTVSEYLS